MPVASVSYISRDTTTLAKSNAMVSTTDTNNINSPQIYSFDSDLSNPFGELGVDLSDAELRETAYEICIGACRSSGGSRPLTYASSSERTMERQLSMSSAPSLQRAVASTAASKVKKALGLKSSKKSVVSQQNSVSSKRAVTIGELC